MRGAVVRNRVRRRLREAYRATRDGAPEGVQVVVIGKVRAVEAAREALERELASAWGTLAVATRVR